MRDLSRQFVDSINAVNNSEVFLVLLTLSHSSFTGDIHLVNNNVNITSRGVEYEAVGFKFIFAPDDNNTMPTAKIGIDNVDRKLVEKELVENRQFKLVADEKIACVWAVTYQDLEIWGARNEDSAIYIHRIATNPEMRGHNFVQIIVDWSRAYPKLRSIDHIRLDTLGKNLKLIEHYRNAGFEFFGYHELFSLEGLPGHYDGTEPVCLFEIKV